MVTFAEEIPNGKLHFLCSDTITLNSFRFPTKHLKSWLLGFRKINILLIFLSNPEDSDKMFLHLKCLREKKVQGHKIKRKSAEMKHLEDSNAFFEY